MILCEDTKVKKLSLALAATILLFACSEEPAPRPVVGVVVDDVLLNPIAPNPSMLAVC